MNVEHRLPAFAVAVHDQPVAGRIDATLNGEAFGAADQGAEQTRLLFGYIVHGGNVLLGNNENVRRRLRTDVIEREYVLVLVNDVTRNFASDELAEQAVAGHVDFHRKLQFSKL